MSHDSYTRIIAYDALGIMGQTILSMPLTLNPADYTLAQAARVCIARAGLLQSDLASLSGSIALFQWAGGENGLSALYRLLRSTTASYRSRCSFESQPQVQTFIPETASQYTYGVGAHPIISQLTDDNGQNVTLAVAHGMTTLDDPTDGEIRIMRQTATGHITSLHRKPEYYLNRHMDETDITNLATAAYDRISRQRAVGWIDAQANLSLEPSDRITVNGTQYYVYRITERYNRRRLTQRIYIATA